MTVIINGTNGITSVNGTAAAPSVTGTDTDTGIVYGTNTLSLVTGGTTAMTIDSSQNVTFADGSKNLTLQQGTAAATNSTSYPGYIAFTGYGWNTSLGSSPLGVRIGAAGAYSVDLGGQVAPGLSISTQNTNGSMTQRMLLNGFGIGLGTGTYPISGTGIKFPASQDASSDANTLDDYEEGSWTPVLAGVAGGSGTGTITTYTARYVKIGKIVTVYVYASGCSRGTMSGSIGFTGLPFAAASLSGSGNYAGAHLSYWASLLTAVVNITCYTITGSTSVELHANTVASTTNNAMNSSFVPTSPSTCELIWTISYETSS